MAIEKEKVRKGWLPLALSLIFLTALAAQLGCTPTPNTPAWRAVQASAQNESGTEKGRHPPTRSILVIDARPNELQVISTDVAIKEETKKANLPEIKREDYAGFSVFSGFPDKVDATEILTKIPELKSGSKRPRPTIVLDSLSYISSLELPAMTQEAYPVLAVIDSQLKLAQLRRADANSTLIQEQKDDGTVLAATYQLPSKDVFVIQPEDGQKILKALSQIKAGKVVAGPAIKINR